MPLSNMINAFNQSSTDVTAKDALDRVKSKVEDGVDAVKEGLEQVREKLGMPEPQPSDEVDHYVPLPSDNVDKQPDKDALLARIREDVDFSYDEETNTFNIDSGEITPATMRYVREYFDATGDEYKNFNLVVGEDVTFDNTSGLRSLDPHTASLDRISFAGIDCNCIDIRSQNITDADFMFRNAEANIIKLADQPNLTTAHSMFDGCDARAVIMGDIPAEVQSQDDMFKGCSSVVLNPDLTRVLYDPEYVADVVKVPEPQIVVPDSQETQEPLPDRHPDFPNPFVKDDGKVSKEPYYHSEDRGKKVDFELGIPDNTEVESDTYENSIL